MSLDEDTVYIGAVAIDEKDNEYRYADKLDKIEIYRYFKIAFPKGSTTTAETISLYCTLSHLQLKENKDIIVYIDSQGLFDTINDIFKSRKFSFSNVLSQLKELIENIKIKNNTVDIRLVKGHSKVWGNDIANDLATRAREGYEINEIENI